jgi:transcriptional regulator with XRE-family HTH domain
MATDRDPDRDIARAIRAARPSKGMTQADLAAAAGRHNTWVNRLERGRVNPTWASIVRVADALGVSPAALAALAEIPERKTPPDRKMGRGA